MENTRSAHPSSHERSTMCLEMSAVDFRGWVSSAIMHCWGQSSCVGPPRGLRSFGPPVEFAR
eukprot:5513525-Pyramimonas_sp.AAC.1